MTDETHREEQVTALVLLRSASGEAVTGETPITTETLARYAPSAEDADHVARSFRDAGFEVGPAFGISLTVTAPRGLVEDYFGTPVARAADGGWVATEDAESGVRELPLSGLPPDVTALVSAVTFDEPAEPVGL